MKLVIDLGLSQSLQCSPHELHIVLCDAFAEYIKHRCRGNAEAYVAEREQRYPDLYQNRTVVERQQEIECRQRQFADAEALRNHLSAHPVVLGHEPCGYCGSTDGYDTSYDGWPRCNSCHGC